MINEESLNSWEKTTLGNIADYINGRAFKPTEWQSTGIPIIRIQNLNKPTASYNYYQGELEEKYKVKNGDLLYSWSASLDSYIWSEEDAYLNQHIFNVKPYGRIRKKFIYYLLKQISSEILSKTHGMGMVHITKGNFERIEVLIPPLNEQDRIIDKIEVLYSETDAGIANLTLAKRQLEQYRQSLLKHAFEGKLTAKWREEYAKKHGKSLSSADELLEQIQTARQDYYDQKIVDWEEAVKDWEEQGKEGTKPRKPSKLDDVADIDDIENLPTLPDKWRFHRLADIAEVGSGISVSKNRKVDNPIEVNYLRVANVQRGYLDLDEVKTMNIDKFTFNRYKLLEGDILFNEGGDRDKLGRGWIWRNEVDNCITQNHVFRASTHIKNIAHSEFISHWGNTFGRDYFERTGKQTTNLASINKTVLSSFPVPYPSIEEQSLIVKLLSEKTSEVDKLEVDLELQLKKATLLKTSILHKAFQGKLVPQDPTDPPASELLAQIKAEREAKALAEKQAKQNKAASKSKAKTKSAKTLKKSKKDEQITLPL